MVRCEQGSRVDAVDPERGVREGVGHGHVFSAETVSFLFGAGGQIRPDEKTGQEVIDARWQFCHMDYASHRIAVVIERTPGLRLKRAQMRSPGGIPVALPDGEERWFQSAPG